MMNNIGFYSDKLKVKVFPTREEMGAAAANDVSAYIVELLKTKPRIAMIFAAAPSQNELLSHLLEHDEIDFTRITAFHMDEYIGLDSDAPQGFGNFLRARLFNKKQFGRVYFIDGQSADPTVECGRYAELLAQNPPDIVCGGIGENGHIAFNDPQVADFNDTLTVKQVRLDDDCRRQQVHDGCFSTLDEVPEKAITLTIPALMKCARKFFVVPGQTKATAVYNTLNGPVDEKCPASILRREEGAILYLDSASASRLKQLGLS